MSDQSPESSPVLDESQSVAAHASPGPNETARSAQPPPLSIHEPPRLLFAESPKQETPPRVTPRPPPPNAYAVSSYYPAALPPSPSPGYPPPYGHGGQPSYYSPPYAVQPPTYVVQAPPSTSGAAVASLVCGILGFLFLPLIGSIIAVLCGYAAMNEIESSRGRIGGSGMAMAGLVLGWLQLAGWAIIFFFVFIVGRQIANA